MAEAGGGDLVAVVTLAGPPKGRGEGVAVDRLDTQFTKDPGRITHRGRLHDSGQDQLEERLIVDNVEPQPLPSARDDLDKKTRELVLHDRPPWLGCRAEIEVQF